MTTPSAVWRDVVRNREAAPLVHNITNYVVMNTTANASAFDAAVHATIVMGIAGEIAAERATGPGSFWIQFLDALYALQESDITTRMRASES